MYFFIMTKRISRIMASVIATLICVSIFTTIPAIAETGVSVLDYDDYNIKYSIVNEWSGYQNIEITLTNTGAEPIYNWALGYNAGGEIEDLWNGTVEKQIQIRIFCLLTVDKICVLFYNIVVHAIGLFYWRVNIC